MAASERNRLGLGDGPILNLREVLESDVGLRVFYTELPSDLAGIFAYTEELGGCIAVNSRHPEERRRWSMAHEYGHFLTSRFRPELTILGRFERIPASERFADAFAAALLMPASGLRRRFYQISRAAEGGVTAAEVCRMAHYYFVSVEAMMLRLEELRLLPGGTWERLRDRGSGFGKPRNSWVWRLTHTMMLRFLYAINSWRFELMQKKTSLKASCVACFDRTVSRPDRRFRTCPIPCICCMKGN